jgi:ATP-binding cassette subfamily E protein 1
MKKDMQAKKSFAMMDYEKCRPRTCDPENGVCTAGSACTHKVIKQLDGRFESPAIFQDMCMGCWDCIDACPLDVFYIKNVT